MKQLFAIFFLLSFALVPASVLGVGVNQACGDTDNDPTSTVVACDAGLVCTGGLCISEGDLPPGTLRLASDTEVPTSGAAILSRIQLISNWVFAIFLAISLIYILLAAFQFVTGGGDPAMMNAARQKLIYALVGIAIALIAAGFPLVIRNIVT